MPTYIIEHPAFVKPRVVDAGSPKEARAFITKAMTARRIGVRECFDICRDQGIELEVAEKGGPS
jgi:hypothetical protein